MRLHTIARIIRDKTSLCSIASLIGHIECILMIIDHPNPQNSIHVHWRPPYPPTGRVEKYVVRVGINNTDGKFGDSEVIWRHRIEVKF